ncbi:MAG: aminoacyl-tRNA hydrolase [Bacteriovoracaceae bacterium]
MQYLIVGLGNPGKEYAETRHNIGEKVLIECRPTSGMNWSEKFKGFYGKVRVRENDCIFLRPQTYMNLSGESVVKAAQFFKIEPSEILIVHDELDLPYGQVAFKKGGGLAGNNGLKSVAQCLGTKDFLRLRLGIGRPPHGNVSSWVLSKFTKDEQITLDDYITKAGEIVEEFAESDFGAVATRWSRKSLVN